MVVLFWWMRLLSRAVRRRSIEMPALGDMGRFDWFFDRPQMGLGRDLGSGEKNPAELADLGTDSGTRIGVNSLAGLRDEPSAWTVSIWRIDASAHAFLFTRATRAHSGTARFEGYRDVMRQRLFYMILTVLLAVVLGNGLYHSLKPLPPGISVASPLRPVHGVEFLTDHTWLDGKGDRHTEQVIFDRVFELIQSANRLLVLDMFLFNAMQGSVTETHRLLSRELTQNLVQRMRERPGLVVVIITDPFNSLYGGVAAPHLEALQAAGAHLVWTDLNRLRDPNPVWSAPWRLCCQWLGNSTSGWLPNPVGEEPVTLRTYLALLNLKANHRKTLVADDGDDWVALVTSANPHDASSAHVNTAVVFRGQAALDLLDTETAVIRFSARQVPFEIPADLNTAGKRPLQAQIITESRIREAALDTIRSAAPGDRLDIAMFYFSHEGLIRAVKAAALRGVAVRILLDPNRDAFGRQKSGIPNRQTGRRFHDAGIPVRWCRTSGEQCHAKQLVLERTDGQVVLITGSANFTRRNLDDFNLETSVRFVGPADDPVLGAALSWFEQRWNNAPGWQVSQPYESWEDRSVWRSVQSWAGETLGWSSF